MSDEYDWMCFLDPELDDEARTSAIADQLQAGQPSHTFCRYLAGMIDPRPGAKNATSWKLELKRLRGRPKGHNEEVGKLMMQLVDVQGEKYEAAIAEVSAKYCVSRTNCMTALRLERKYRSMSQLLDRLASNTGGSEN